MICFFETIPILHITIRRYQYNTNTMTSSGFNTNTNTNTSETLFAIPRPIPIPLTYFFQYQYRYDTESIEKFRFQYRNCADTDQYRTALVQSLVCPWFQPFTGITCVYFCLIFCVNPFFNVIVPVRSTDQNRAMKDTKIYTF